MTLKDSRYWVSNFWASTVKTGDPFVRSQKLNPTREARPKLSEYVDKQLGSGVIFKHQSYLKPLTL